MQVRYYIYFKYQTLGRPINKLHRSILMFNKIDATTAQAHMNMDRYLSARKRLVAALAPV